MMFIKPGWFKRRSWGGWGITPATWQGCVALAVIVAPAFALGPLARTLGAHSLSFLSIAAAYLVAFLILVGWIMIHVPMDERQRAHEAIADRNALWVILLVLALGILGDALAPEFVRGFHLNPFVLGGLIAAWITKLATLVYLDRND